MRAQNPSRDACADPACESCGAAAATSEALRCPCGSLLARYTEAGVELKCRRCKRTVVVPVAGSMSGGATSF